MVNQIHTEMPPMESTEITHNAPTAENFATMSLNVENESRTKEINKSKNALTVEILEMKQISRSFLLRV